MRELELLKLRTRRHFFSKRVGENVSKLSGSGIEFKDIISYDSSLSARHINWKKSTKQSVVANSYYESRELNIALIYLNSGSMRFSSKAKSAQDVLNTLSIVANENKEALATMLFNSKSMQFFAPTKKRAVVGFNHKLFKEASLQGEIDYTKLNQAVVKTIPKRSILFIVGDFLELPNFSKLTKFYEINALIIRDKKEELLDIRGEVNLLDLNSNKEEQVSIDKSCQKLYNKLMQEHDKVLFQGFRGANIRFTKIYTNQDAIKQLTKLTI